MTEKELYQILGEIDPVMIEAAAPDVKIQKIKISWPKWIAVAACFALVLLTCVLPLRESPEGTVASLFTITARAADGEKIELEYGSYLSNSGSEGDFFGVDMPTFNFTILPSDLENNEVVFSRFNISVSYNGKVVDESSKDPHIAIAYQIATPYLPIAIPPQTYSVTGWFTDPTDVVITITDRETNVIAEEITINVKYDADRQEYELKITNWEMKYK